MPDGFTASAASRNPPALLASNIPMPQNSHVIDVHDIMSVLPMNFDDCQLFTMREAAAGLTVSKRTLERLIAAGEFPKPVKLGRSSRVPASDIAAYIEGLIRRRNSGRAT